MGDYPTLGNKASSAEAGPFQNLKGDVYGGIAAAVIALPVAISCGLVAFAPLGPDFAAQGVLAGLYTAIFLTVLASLFGGTPLQISGPKSSLAVILAAFLAGLLQDPMLGHGTAERVEIAVSLVFLCVLLAGGFQILFSVMRLGNVIKFIPYPVTVGFMNGLAIIIILSQVPLFLEQQAFSFTALLEENVAVKGSALIIAGVTIAAMWAARYWLKGGGDAVVALLAGTGFFYFLSSTGTPGTPPPDLGGIIGTLPLRPPTPEFLPRFVSVITNPDNSLLLWKTLQNAFVLGVLASIESLLSATAMDTHADTRHRSNRELMGQGIGNIVAGCFGGLAGGGSPTRGTANFSAGGRTRLSSIIHGLLFLSVVTVAGGVVGLIPLAVTAGILFVYAIRLADNWTRQLVVKAGQGIKGEGSKDFYLNLSVVVLVTVLTIATDLIIAVGVGFAISSFLFIVSAGQSPIYRHYRGDRVHSKNARPLELMELLKSNGQEIVVVEAQGPIFFGSAESLAERLEQFSDQSDFIILDLRRVTQIDATGAHIFARLENFMTNKGKTLLISHLSENQPLWGFLREMDVITPETKNRVFSDLDSAMAWAEDRVLERFLGQENAGREIPLHDLEIMEGITKEQITSLEGLLERKEFKKGDCIFEEGAEGDAMYFVAAGAVSVRGQLPGGDRLVRLAGIGTGMVFGEMAILGDIPRTAGIYADEDVVCYALTREAFQKIAHRHTDIGIRLLLNLGRQSAHRLEMTSEEVRALER